jgi:hypothetical protein
MNLRAICLCILLSAPAVQVGTKEQLELRVSPITAFAPATVRVHTIIEADPANRAVEVVAESEDFYRSSEIPLEGENARRTTVLEFRSLPPGLYQVKATLLGMDRTQRASVIREISVLATGGN